MLITSIALLSASLSAVASIDLDPPQISSQDGGLEIIFDEATIAALSAANDTQPAWKCDVRVWTRAPDLSPGKVFPADARLAANGSACGDIVQWNVGMRLKERAMIKKRAKGVEFPQRPIQPVWNESFYSIHATDFNDVLKSNMYYSPHQDPAEKEYEAAMEIYYEELQNASLWLISGQERVVYDITHEMALEANDHALIDVTQAFAIHMPHTNFPPIERFWSGYSSGQDDQMLVTETLSEFYHLIALSNGTILDIPSGKIGILPARESIKPSASIRDSPIGDITWPQTIDFAPTNRNSSKPEASGDDFDHGHERAAPTCDKYNAANFALRVDTNVTQPILGQNITINFTLTRTGNGSEYPAWLEITHTSHPDITWARQFVDNDTEYESLQNGGMGLEESRWMWGAPRPKLRLMPPAKQLEEDKRVKERSLDGEGYMDGCSRGMTWGELPGRVRYEMWDEDHDPQDEYAFGLEVVLPDRGMPSFEKTFERIRSSLVITLHTYFICDVPNVDRHKVLAVTSPELSEIDNEWDNYALPTRKPKRRNIALGGMEFPHTSLIPLDAALCSETAGATPFPVVVRSIETAQIVHYLDDSALGPVLTGSMDDVANFPRLGQAIHEETEEERKRNRWGPHAHQARREGWCERPNASGLCYELNGGGGSKLASAMWQSKLAKEHEALSGRAEGTPLRAGPENKNTNNFVVQA